MKMMISNQNANSQLVADAICSTKMTLGEQQCQRSARPPRTT